MKYTVQDVRQEILKEFGIDISADTIRRDGLVGLYEVGREEDNNYRIFHSKDVKMIKYISLLRDLGIPREKIKQVLDGDKQLVWERMNQLINVTIPSLKARL